MTKFDFKKWVIANKHRKKPLNENYGMVNEAPPTDCDTAWPSANCHAFSKCVSGQSDNSHKAINLNGAATNPGSFHSQMGSPDPVTDIGLAIDDNQGQIWIYDGLDDDAQLNTEYLTIPISETIVTCTPPTGFECPGGGQTCVGGCTTPTAGGPCFIDPQDCQNTCDYGWECPGQGLACTNTCIQGTTGCSTTDTACQNTCDYTICQNCCCKERGGDAWEEGVLRENLNPTIKGISDLISEAEGRRGEEPTIDKEREKPTKLPKGGPGPSAAKAAPSSMNDPQPIGGCKPGTFFDPIVSTIIPSTGQCRCPNPGTIAILSIPNPNPGQPC